MPETALFSKNKWINLLIYALVSLVLIFIVIHTTKVVDATGKPTGNTLKTFVSNDTTTPPATK